MNQKDRGQTSTRQIQGPTLPLIALGLLLVLIVAGYFFEWTWTGFPEKRLFDWLQILVFPVAVAIGTFVLNQAANRRQQEAQKEEKDRGLAIEEQHAQDAALEAYLGHMTQLLLGEQLLTSGRDDVVRKVARAQTLTVLGRLGPGRKGSVLLFLHESKLIEKYDPIISLKGADLREAKLGLIELPKANLSGADLKWANLYGVSMPEADLSGAHLEWATISGYLPQADLSNAHLLGATISETDLEMADLRLAGVFGTDLTGAKHLTQDQIEAAMGDKNTLLPFYLKQPQDWKSEDIATKWRFDVETGSVVYEPDAEPEGMEQRG